jgi:hypothetical protein
MTRGIHSARTLHHRMRRSARLANERFTQRILEQRLFFRLLPRIVKHIHGPGEISYAPDELIVLCVVRNGELYIKSFVDHYSALPVKHIVFLDNGSTDATVDLLREYDVTVLQAETRYRQQAMNLYLLNRFSRGRWGLLADIDEFFDYPFSDTLSLRNFMRYLNVNSYTAVLTQVLDIFSTHPLDELKIPIGSNLGDIYTHYDISSIRKTEYTWPGLEEKQIKWHFGGIRNDIFGTDSSLTKPALLFFDGEVKAFFSVHHVRGARIADVSCVLLHYPFAGSFRAKVEDALQTGSHAKAKWDYEGYWRVLRQDPHPVLASPSARRLAGLEELIDENFLVVSPQYLDWVQRHVRTD